MSKARRFLCEAIALAQANMENGGRPFGALVVKDGKVVATGVNEIIASNDPTAHAELMALRAAGRALGSPNLAGCTVYASGHPCPMCMAAMRLSGIARAYYAYSNDDGAAYGLSTAAVYAELAKSFSDQSMRAGYLPVRLDDRPDLYAEWKRRQAGPA